MYGRSIGGLGRPGARTGEEAGLVSGRSLGDLGGGDLIHEVGLILSDALFAALAVASIALAASRAFLSAVLISYNSLNMV